MRKLIVFEMVSLDGYFEGLNHDISWHNVDDEFNKFAIGQLKEADTIIFGRRTYQLFESYWPKAAADPYLSKENIEIAHMINNLDKIVFSRTMKKVEEKKNWKNVKLVNELRAEEIVELKQKPGKDIWVGGSSDLVVSLIKLGLVDEIRVMVNPVFVGDGKPLFKGIKDRLKMNLVMTRTFKSGNVLLYYKLAQNGKTPTE